MSDVLNQDADALHRALAQAGDEVQVKVSRQTAEWLAQIIAARSRGERVIVTRGHAEVTPAEAAALLGVSRPQIRKFMNEGKLSFRLVGAHHRIPLHSIEAFRKWEQQQMVTGMGNLSRVQNDLGLVE